MISRTGALSMATLRMGDQQCLEKDTAQAVFDGSSGIRPFAFAEYRCHSQSIKTGKMGGERGYDGGKRVKGRKRHIATDSLGLPLAVSVTAANVHDLTGAKKVFAAST